MIESAISFWGDIKRYEDMLEADPRSYCFAPLSELYRKLGLIDDAIAVAKKGCRVHPDYPGGFLALAGALMAKGEMTEAREALEKVTAANPENIKAQKLLSQIYAETGETALARQALQRVLADNPADTESALLLRTLSATDAEAAPADESLEELELVEELTEELPEGEEVSEDELLNVNALFEAEELFASEELAEELPEGEEPGSAAGVPPVGKDPLSTATMAELYVSQGFPEKALRIYHALLEDESGNPTYTRRVVELERLVAGAAEETGTSVTGAAHPRGAQVLPATEQAAQVPPEVNPAAALSAAGQETVEILEKWLENIRKRREHAL